MTTKTPSIESPAKTHEITFDRVNAGILAIHAKGRRITVVVYRKGKPWKPQDYIVFTRQSGETTRYRVDEIRTPRDPGDQHFIDCTFAPRTNGNPV